MNARSRLSVLLNIEPGEGRLVALMLAQSFFIGSARIFTRSSAYALFLAEFDAAALPFIYIGIGIIVTLLSILYLQLSARISFSKLLIANAGFLTISLLGFRFGLIVISSRWLVFLLPIWYEVLWTLTNLGFWNLAGRLFNLRQGKRLFGLVGAGEQAATIIGGLLVPLIVSFINTANLLLIASASMAGVLALLFYTCASNADSLAVQTVKNPARKKKSSPGLLKNPYILAIFGLFILDIVTYFTVDNIFYAQAQAQIPSEASLASFIGIFFGVCGLLSLLSRTFLTGQILNRYGVRISLLILPLLMLASSVPAAITGAVLGAALAFFGFVVLMRLIEMVFLVSIELPTINILYQPLPAAQRVETQALVEGIVYSLSIGLTGVVLWILTSLVGLTVIQLVYVVVVLVLIWTSLAVLMGRLYPKALVGAITSRRLDSAQIYFDEAQSVRILEQGLHSSHAGTVIYAMNMLEELQPEILDAALPGLLNHPDEAVRQDVLQRMERLCLTSAVDAIRSRLEREASPVVRGAAICTLGALDGIEAYAAMSAVMDDPLPPVRRGAMVGLLRNGGIEGVLEAGNKLLEEAKSPDPVERVYAAQVLGEVGIRSFYQPLVPLLQDESLAVRRSALHAAGQIKNPRLWPEVIEELKVRPLRAAAISVLASGGTAVLPELNLAYAQAGQDRAALVEACGRIGGSMAIAWLKDRLNDPSITIRTQVLRALSRCNYQAHGEEASLIHRQIESEAALATGLLAVLTDLGECEAITLLREAFSQALVKNVERIFFLLSFIYDTRTILGARDNLALAAKDRRAYAIEILDVTLGRELKRWLLPLVNNLPSSQKLHQLSAYFPQPRLSCDQRLQEIITHPDERATSWTRACALYTVGCMKLNALSGVVTAALSASDPLVKETAAWTMARLGETEYSQEISPPSPSAIQPIDCEAGDPEKPSARRSNMLTTIEKVIALKKVSIFAATPDETLVDVAALLEEVSLFAGETIFEKGDPGDCMYIIVDGEVRVHDGERSLNHLATGDVFGEMAVLDWEPRSASVTAVVDTHLLQLSQEPLFALTDEQPEVARRIIRVLSHHLRARVQDLNELRSRLDQVKT